ncbi:hypothetical protein Tco_0480382 [Tanacetum coccineum]
MALGYQNPFYLKQAQQKQQSLYNGKVLLEKHDPPTMYDSEETLQLAQESRLKMKHLNKEIKPTNYAKINRLSRVFVSQTSKSREELYFSNTSKIANVSKSISIRNEEFSDDTTPNIHNWSSSVHQEIHKIVKDEIFPIVNQVDARVQNFEIFFKEAAKFVRDSTSLANEDDESLAKHKTLEFEIERLLRAVVNQYIMSIVQNPTVVETSDLQTEIERLQAQLGDLKGKCNDTSCVADTLDPLSQKLENENVELEFQLFDKTSEQKDTTKGTSVNTQFRKQSILGKPPSSFSRSKLYSVTPFPKSKGLPKIDKTHALSKPVTSNSLPTLQESKVVKNDNVIAQGMFRINPFKTSREEKFVPNKPIKASVGTKKITISQPHVITKKDVNADSNGLSSIGVDNTVKTRRPQPRSNTKNDRNDKSEVVCAMYKQCLITANHDVCVLNYVNGMNSHGKKQKANVSNPKNQKKHKLQDKKPKKVGSTERLASYKPSKPRSFLRWSPTGRIFDLKGKITSFSELESQSDCSNGDDACISNPQEPTRKRFLWSLLELLRSFITQDYLDLI